MGLPILNRFDAYDALETEDDLTSLFETLMTVTDCQGNHAHFTAYTVPANIDFESLGQNGFSKYTFESITTTYSKIDSCKSIFRLWKEGIAMNLIKPQFHGREHLNVKTFEANLLGKDPFTIEALKNRSYTSIVSKPYKHISYTATYDIEDTSDLDQHEISIISGLDLFESVFGFRASLFNSPGGREHSGLHDTLANCGIEGVESPWIKKEHRGRGKYRYSFNYTGKKNKSGQKLIVRNCLFEPTADKNAVRRCLDEMDIAFELGRPAIISSHRVNFSGRISEENRKVGLENLRVLLEEMLRRWPTLEFISEDELLDRI